MREIIETDNAPAPIGPYSQAIRAGGFVFVSGQIPLDPGSGTVVSGDITNQTRQVLRNVAAILEAAGTSLSKVVKTTIYLVNLDDFAAFNDAYAEFMGTSRPARATVEVSRLPKGVLVEVEVVALA